MSKHYFYKKYKRMRRGACAIALLTLFSCQYIFVSDHYESKKVIPVEVAADSIPPSKSIAIDDKDEPIVVEEKVDLGSFKLTAYCHCVKCCGKSDGITATGTKAIPNRTIAVDPKVIPLGSKVVIDNHTYIAEDTGGVIKGNKIDIYFSTHQEALNFGVQYKNVYILNSL